MKIARQSEAEEFKNGKTWSALEYPLHDTDITIAELLEKHSKEVGKKLHVKSFVRWNVGS